MQREGSWRGVHGLNWSEGWSCVVLSPAVTTLLQCESSLACWHSGPISGAKEPHAFLLRCLSRTAAVLGCRPNGEIVSLLGTVSGSGTIGADLLAMLERRMLCDVALIVKDR